MTLMYPFLWTNTTWHAFLCSPKQYFISYSISESYISIQSMLCYIQIYNMLIYLFIFFLKITAPQGWPPTGFRIDSMWWRQAFPLDNACFQCIASNRLSPERNKYITSHDTCAVGLRTFSDSQNNQPGFRLEFLLYSPGITVVSTPKARSVTSFPAYMAK